MQMWREYLEQYADREGDVKAQITVAAYHTAGVYGWLSQQLDRDGLYEPLIDQRIGYFEQAKEVAADFEDQLVNATFSLYNHLNSLSHELIEGDPDAATLVEQIDEQVRSKVQAPGQIERCIAALTSSFPLVSLMTLVMDQDQSITPSIRKVEHRFASGFSKTGSAWDRFVHALYRNVEMIQLFATASDFALAEQVNQIATRFEEEDEADDVLLKVRNGFCRLFELGHLVATHLDDTN
jgi:hypothetical protein